MEKVRGISDGELMFCDVQELVNSYTIQFLVEFTGNISIKEIEDTINEIVIKNPGSNVFKNKNNWFVSKDRIYVKELTFDSEAYMLNEDFFNETTNFKKHSIELYLLNTKDKKRRYLVFKFFHGVIDGKGAILIIENFVNKICGKEEHLLKNDITDKEFIKNQNYYNEKVKLKPKYSLNDINKINNYKLQWNVLTIDNYIPNIVAKISKILQKHFKNDTVKFMIPVDLRNYDRTTKRIGNLILPIYIDVNKDDDINKIGGELLLSLKEKKELNMYSAKGYNYHIYPEKIRRFVIKKFFNYLRNKNKYFVGAIVSHLGRLTFNSSYKFNIENVISLPNHQPLTPFSIVITEYKNKTNIAICSYKNQIPKDTLKSIIEDMEGVE